MDPIAARLTPKDNSVKSLDHLKKSSKSESRELRIHMQTKAEAGSTKLPSVQA